MQRVFVLDTNYQPLMPCHPARAKALLDKGKTAVYRRYPFTIILKYAVEANNQPVAFKVDPGSRTSGIVLVADFKRGQRVIWAGAIQHRRFMVWDPEKRIWRNASLWRRAILRRGRRGRKTRYRQPRFNNRRRLKGWLPPSLQSRVGNIYTWLKRLYRFAPITSLSLELVRFDTQKLQNPEISGVEYQQGELAGYEVREYLLEKWGRKCVYCGAENVPLEVEHIIPKSRGGPDRVSNLTIACTPCNQAKGSQTAEEYGHPEVQQTAKKPLRDAAAVNATRWALYRHLEATGLPLEIGTGGRTKYNRTRQGYPKAHWLDAACVGESGERVYAASGHTPLLIKATGRQSRQMCCVDQYGFPRGKPKQSRISFGFQTGDLVRAVVPKGKHTGTHAGRVAVRASGSFRVGTVDGISWRYCQLLHQADGYEYTEGGEAHSSQA